jgi:large subunit ribosomal protein L7/L12
MGAQVEVVQPEKAPPPAPKPIDASTPGAAPGPAPTPGPTEPTERFPTPVEPRPWSFDAGNFDVVVLSPGPRKDMVAALLARILGVGLDQAQELLARRVSAVKRGISAEDADLLRQQLDLAGAAVEIAAHRHTPEHRSTPAPKAAFFDVVLTDPGPNKIATRKALKNHLGLDLLQAYNAVEQTPSILKQDIARTEAERLKSVLEAAGATVELRPAEPS